VFARLGATVHDHRRAVLWVAALAVALAAVVGTSVFGRLVDGGFEDPDSESQRAVATAERAFGRTAGDVLAVYSSDALTVADQAFRTEVTSVLDALPADDVASVTSTWSTGSPSLVSSDGRSTLVVLQLAGDTDVERAEAYDRVAAALVPSGDVEVLRGGPVATGADIGHQVERDIVRAELLSFPVLLVLLVVVFGGLVAAGLPLLVGGVAVLGAFLSLRLLTELTDVSVFAVNIVTMLGLGLAIDYALFVVSRFREELRSRPRSSEAVAERAAVRAAVTATMDTAGRTVAVSGLVVAVALTSLLFFPQLFLRSMGLGGISAVLVAMLASLTLLPALLAVLGRRVDALRLPVRRRGGAAPGTTGDADEQGGWARLARTVMRRPVPVALATVAVLVSLGLPALGVQFGGVDERVLPAGTESRLAAEAVAEGFPAATSSPVEVVVEGAEPGGLAGYVDALAVLPGATGAQVVEQAPGTALVEVGFRGPALTGPAEALVDAVRDVPAPAGAQVLVGGETAGLQDLLGSLAATAPLAIGVVVAATLVLLFLAFGSVVLPVKAVAMNVLSLGATLGVLVWGFQEGGLAPLLGFTETGTVEATQLVLILAIAFGLSMDYEVFLLSRVREEWDRTGDSTRAVAIGLQRSGRIITSAAVLLLVVFLAFSTSGITFIQMIGVGVAAAIVVDATVVRALLVPATMRLLGSANWWLPRPLQAVYGRLGLREGSELAVPAQDRPAERADVPALRG
jgi:RND superfamily putative drug exporter